MLIDKIPAGENVPDVLNAIIEIPARSDPVKYEIEKNSGAVFVDRFVNVPMYYPCNYGFVPQTLSEDGDPLDILVVTPVPVLTGSVIPCRPLDALEMSDEAGRDLKLLATPAPGMNGGYDDARSAAELPPDLLDQIVHFFEHYKALEPGKWVKVEGWLGAAAAKREIMNSVARFTKNDQE